LRLVVAVAVVFAFFSWTVADDKPYSPKIMPASDEPLQAQKRIRVPAGTRVDLFAAEPLLANPVAFCVDEHNRFYVAESFRIKRGVEDIRDLPAWLDEDLACRTVADRIAMIKKRLGKNADRWATEHERVRLVEDTTGSGKADKATVFADGFHQLEDGIGAGLFAHHGTVWYTCIPSLWQLQDTKGTGKADARKMLQTGYGVRIGFYGHDLHGLCQGPDGKLYFSIGDRGLHVEIPGRAISNADSGAVLRCNPDGSDLELFATGLRNPQSLTFDQYGNLFTGDNNADHGDKARWVYVVEGGDSGWRVGYQHLMQPTPLGPWNMERLWEPKAAAQAGYIVPPVANIADGPSGVAYEPGTSALPARYREHFFLCDFRGGSANSGIRSFALKPRGASFEMIDQHECVWSVLATDVRFAPDGGLYCCDWVEGWGLTGKGRLWRIHDPSLSKDPKVQEVKKLLAEGFGRRPNAELEKLLEHADMRVRQEAQFALAEKGKPGAEALARVAREGKQPLARLHGIWGLGQMGRKEPAVLKPVLALLGDKDTEVRAQSAKALGEAQVRDAYEPLITLLRDPEARVRFFAAQSLGKLGKPEAATALLQMLRENADQDPFVRHAGVVALAQLVNRPALLGAARDDSAPVRLGALLALRRLGSPEVSEFLDDREPRLVLEATRAINDVPIHAALPKLAALIERPGLPEPVAYRVLNANFRLGKPENATALAAFAGRGSGAEALRVEALRLLGEWAAPSGRDRVVGLWRPLERRPAEAATDAVRARLGGIFSGPDKVRQQAAKLAAQYGIKDIGPTLLTLLADTKSSPQARVEMLEALAVLKDERLPDAVKLALGDAYPQVRAAGRRIQAQTGPAEALPGLAGALDKGEQVERQGALATLADMKSEEADAILAGWLDKLLANQVPAEIRLDLLEAAGRRATASIKEKLARFEAARSKNDHLAKFREALAGGDADTGRRIFLYKAEVSCLRCHKIKGEGGEVGPDLTGIGARQPREYLLESIVDPNRQIAQGYETVVLVLKNGQIVTGIVKAEDGKEVRLMTAESKLVSVAKDQIDERQKGKSPMPEDIMKFLSKRELRDLVEFLASLKEGGPPKKP
jgi:quinoprotein glucose dehydrogenase